MKYWWRIITTPSCWFRNAYSCPYWSKTLNTLLDSHPTVEFITVNTVRLGNTVNIWTSNYPYAFGSIYSPRTIGVESSILPDRSTVFRLYDYIMPKKYEMLCAPKSSSAKHE